jgi:hypothetical protein
MGLYQAVELWERFKYNPTIGNQKAYNDFMEANPHCKDKLRSFLKGVYNG